MLAPQKLHRDFLGNSFEGVVIHHLCLMTT